MGFEVATIARFDFAAVSCSLEFQSLVFSFVYMGGLVDVCFNMIFVDGAFQAKWDSLAFTVCLRSSLFGSLKSLLPAAFSVKFVSDQY